MKLSELFVSHDTWCKHHYAKNRQHFVVHAKAADACCWCLDGGLLKVAETDADYALLVKAVTDAIKALFVQHRGWHANTIFCFNDAPETTFEDVQAVIRYAEAKPRQHTKELNA